MSWERWIRCDGCGNSLQADDAPDGWINVQLPSEAKEPGDEQDDNQGLWLFAMTTAETRKTLHLCSWSCVQKLGKMEKAHTHVE